MLRVSAGLHQGFIVITALSRVSVGSCGWLTFQIFHYCCGSRFGAGVTKVVLICTGFGIGESSFGADVT